MGHPGEINIPYLTLPYLTLPYLTLPYLTLPYLTLPYRSGNTNKETWLCDIMFKIAKIDHCSSNPSSDRGSDPSSDPGSDPGSNPGSKFRYPLCDEDFNEDYLDLPCLKLL